MTKKNIDEKQASLKIKPSMYNVIKRMDDKEYIVYNLISQAIAIINDAENDILLGKQFNSVDDLSKLIDAGFLIKEEIDEKCYLKMERCQSIYGDNKRMLYTIYTTTNCNARCEYCFEKGWKRKNMTSNTAKDLAKYIIKNIGAEQELFIDWFGGEPLLNIEAIRIISSEINKNESLRKKFQSKIVTNGYLLTESIIKEAKDEWHVCEIQITIDNINSEYNRVKNYIYNDKNPFERVMKNCCQILDENIKLGIRINIDKSNIESIEEIIFYLKKRLSKYTNYFIYFYPIHVSNECFDATQAFSSVELRDVMPYAKELLYKYGYCNSPQSLRLLYRKRFCGARTLNFLVVDVEGNFYKCQDYINTVDLKIGDIYNGVLATKELKKWCNDDISQECEQCKYLPVCQGGCFAARISKTRGLPCAVEINEIDKRLELIYKLIKENKND